MLANLGTLLPFALGIAINPASIVAMILLLPSDKRYAKRLAYFAGWLLGLMTLVIAIFLLFGSWNFRQMSTTANFITWVMLISALILLVTAYFQWRHRPPANAEFLPIKWLRVMPQATSFMALGAGLYFALFNLKNLLLTIVSVLLIGEASFDLYQRMMMALVFLALATSGIAAPVIILATQNDRASAILAKWEYRLGAHNVTINCIVLIVIAVQMLLVSLTRL